MQMLFKRVYKLHVSSNSLLNPHHKKRKIKEFISLCTGGVNFNFHRFDVENFKFIFDCDDLD